MVVVHDYPEGLHTKTTQETQALGDQVKKIRLAMGLTILAFSDQVGLADPILLLPLEEGYLTAKAAKSLHKEIMGKLAAQGYEAKT